ncbi:MAG: hypothetical protein AABN33_13885 [Acidobacteriota bacterium]
MKRITQGSAVLAVTLVLTFATVAISAPKRERVSKYLTITGRVLQVDQQARTLLVADTWSDKLYMVSVPKGQTFKITFGMYMNVPEAELWQARKNDRVRMRCIRSQERLAQLDDGRQVVVMTAAH